MRRDATRRDVTRHEGFAVAPATAQRPATLVCECTKCWWMRFSPQRDRDVAPTRSPLWHSSHFLLFFLQVFKFLNRAVQSLLNEKEADWIERAHHRSMGTIDVFARTGGGRKRRRGPQLYRPVREVHGEMSLWLYSSGSFDCCRERHCCTTSYGTTATRSHT